MKFIKNGLPPGFILPFVGPISKTPDGWLPCDGSIKDSVAVTAYAGLYKALVTDLGFTEKAFTYSAPNIISCPSHGFIGGESIRIRSSSSLPPGLSSTVKYYVVYLTANTFSLSLTPDSPALVLFSSGGTPPHYLIQSLYGLGPAPYSQTLDGQFQLPDLRGCAIQGIGTPTDYVQSEIFGLGQRYNDRMHGHWHAVYGSPTASGGAGFISGAGNDAGGYMSNAKVATPITDGTNGPLRIGNTTRPKTIGLNFVIKY